MRIQETIQTVQQYEQGRATPNQQILAKMERELGIKLRGLGARNNNQDDNE